MKRYKPRNKELIDYVDNNEAIEAQAGSTTLISLEDVDIIIDRVKNSVVLADVIVCPCGSTKYYSEQYKDVTKYYCSSCYQKLPSKN